MYLSTPEEGGETVFVYGPRNAGPQDPTFSACAKARGLSVKPHKRDALLFYSLTPDGKEDEMSVHASCPTTKGVSEGVRACHVSVGAGPPAGDAPHNDRSG